MASMAVSPKEDTNIVYPENAGILNVRDDQYGAKGDGVTDDTAAIQKALSEGLAQHRVVYLPDGVYLVSDTLKWWNAAKAGDNVKGWGPFLQMQGQSRSKTIVRLKEGAEGFGDEEAPKAVIATGSSGSHGGKNYNGGEGNEAFENHLRNFSVDTGKGNAGAVGIDWQASNVGAMRHVSIKGAGYAGIALTRRDNGPGLIKDVSVEGFRFGIRTGQEIAHFTLEDIDLKGQSEVGIWMRDSIVGARHIRSQNSVPAIQMGGISLLSLFDSELLGGEGGAAITTQGTEPRMYVRNLKTAGYAGSVKRRGETQKAILAEWSSDAPLGNGGGKLSLGLPIRDTPEFYDADTKNWADAGAPSGGDDTAQVQAALNAGKSTVYFRYAFYRIRDTLVVPGGVKRIFGIGTSLDAATADKPMFRFAGGKASDLTIVDRFTMGGTASQLFDHTDARTLVLSDIVPFAHPVYRNQKGAGPLFIEDVSSAGFSFAPGTQVWARQWNLEGSGDPKAVNDGATVWGLGMKHESAETLWVNKNGARTELWAGLAYTFGSDKDRPAYINTDASFVTQLAGMTYVGANGYYDLLVKDTQKGQTTELRRAGTVGRSNASTIPLYVSISDARPLVAAAPVENTTPKEKDTMNIKTLAAAAALATAPAIVAPQIATQAQAQTAPKTYKAPDFFDGEEAGKPTGNPLEVGGKAMWTAMQIWPEDILKWDNYKPMNWAGDKWRGAYEFGGQPEVQVAAGKINLGSRGGRGGDGTNPGAKRAAILFTAPAKGTYKVSGAARSFVWEGDKDAGANITFLKHDKATDKITKVKQVATPNETEVPIDEFEVELAAGDDLVMLNAVNSMFTAAANELRNLKIEFTPGAGGAAPTTAGAMKVGQTVEIDGKTFKVVKVEGKKITLESQ